MIQTIRAAVASLAAVIFLSCSQTPATSSVSAVPSAEPQPVSTCPAIGDLNFVCGLRAPEDLVLLPSTQYLIASGMEPGSGLHLIDTRAKTGRALETTVSRDTVRFPGCPGPLDPAQALLHGLSLRPAATGHHTLYATNHGGRESIEVFDIAVEGPSPTASWVGCVLIPEGLETNSVAAFGDGTLVATVLMLPGKAFADIFAGRNTGVVLMWTPGGTSFKALPGTELSGNNGIETSPDDLEFFVASSGQKRIVAFSRTDPSRPLRYAQLAEFAPDNVRLINGQLVTAGMIDDEPGCGGAPAKPEDIRCPRGYIVTAVDPQTMKVTEIARGPAAPPYSGTATAVQVGNDLWLSSFSSDRLAYRSLTR